VRDNFGADDLVRARAVVDDDVLSDQFGYFLAGDTPYRVDRSAGRRRNNQPYGALGVGARTDRGEENKQERC